MNNNELYNHKDTLKNITKVEEFLKQFGTEEEYSKRRQLLKDMNFQDFYQLLINTARIIRNVPEDAEVTFDGEYKYAIGHGAVLKEDKLSCMEVTWNVMKKFINDETLSDEMSLSYATLVFANGTVLTHPFNDGNGRTVRILSYGILNGLPERDFIMKVLLKNAGLGYHEAWTLEGAERFTSYDKSLYKGIQPDIITFSSNKVEDIYVDEKYIRDFLEQFSSNDSVKGIVNQFMTYDNNISVLDGFKFVETMYSNANAEQKQKLNDIFLSIRHRKQFRGTMNAFLTEETKNYKGESIITPSTFQPIWQDMGKEESERAKKFAQRFFEKDVTENGLDEYDIATLPLRVQLLIDRAAYIKRFGKFNDQQDNYNK